MRTACFGSSSARYAFLLPVVVATDVFADAALAFEDDETERHEFAVVGHACACLQNPAQLIRVGGTIDDPNWILQRMLQDTHRTLQFPRNLHKLGHRQRSLGAGLFLYILFLADDMQPACT